MRRIVGACTSMVVIAATLSGCEYAKSLSLSPEAKINAAFPLSEEVRNAKTAITELAPDAMRREIETQFEARLKLRALNCGKGFEPSRLSSTDSIRQKLNNTACFVDTDREIARWLGYRRVALVLAKPPLRPIPAAAPSYIVADETIHSARFASNAGIALVQTSQAIEVIDFESQKPLYRGSKGMSTFVGFLSANGRLFFEGEGGSLKIREAESGSVLVELPVVRPQEFHWLDDKAAVYNKGDTRKAVIIDWGSGREAPITALTRGVLRGVPVPGAENQYVLFTPQGATKIELVRDKAELEVKLIAEQPIPDSVWQLGMADATADGARFFSAFRNLTIVSTTTLEFETIALDPVNVIGGIPTADPDKILFSAQLPGSPGGEGFHSFLYSISSRTVEPIDRAKLIRPRMLYIGPLHRMGAINESKIEVFQDVPTLPAMPMATLLTDQRNISNQRKLDAFEREQAAARGQAQKPVAGMPPPSGPIAQLARDAQIEAVGVYQSSMSKSGGTSPMVAVHVRRTMRPIVLVLSSYEAVRWVVMPEPGSRLAAVLLSGYEESQAFGAGTARVAVIGKSHPYKREGGEYEALNRDVLRATGKPIDLFQGRYDGANFSVGGR